MSQESIVATFDQTYLLSIFVDELDSSYSIRVKDSTTVAKLISDLINRIYLKFNWMEFGLWCKTKKLWLLPKTLNLSHFMLHSNSEIHFIRRYKLMNIQLPDLQYREMILDLSKTVFQTNHIVCRKVGIRHHEELSFQYKLRTKTNNRTSSLMNIKRKTHFESVQDIAHSHLSLRRSKNHSSLSPKKRDGTSFFRSFSNPNNSQSWRKTSAMTSSSMTFNSTYENTVDKAFNDSIYYEGFESSKLSNSPEITCEEAIRNGDIFLYKSYKERSSQKFPWLVSEFTLMEQEIENFDDIVLLLRFKYHNYFYLDEMYDSIRINQVFSQAHWSVLSGETDCSEEEALVLGGILLQIRKSICNTNDNEESRSNEKIESDMEEEIKIILDKLYLELLGRYEDEIEEKDVSVSGVINLVKYPKNLFKSYEKYYAEIQSDGIHLYINKKSPIKANPVEIIPIKGNEVELRIKYSRKELFLLEIINLQNEIEILKNDKKNIEKYRLRFFDKNECIRWATGCRLLSKSIDFKKVGNFQYEYNVVSNTLDMMRPRENSNISNITMDKEESGKTDLNEYIPSRVNKPFRKKLYLARLLQFQKSCCHYTQIQSKIAYIKCWLTLRNAGIYYFQVTMNKKAEKELVGIGYNRLINAYMEDGKLKRIWELEKLVTWNTNWELILTILQFPNESIHLGFSTISECQMFHEYVGGYLFIMMRNSEKYSDLSEKTFRKLTARHLSRT